MEQAARLKLAKHAIIVRSFFIREVRFLQLKWPHHNPQQPCQPSAGKVSKGGDALESSDLKNAGLKVTLPRIKILKIIENSFQNLFEIFRETTKIRATSGNTV